MMPCVRFLIGLVLALAGYAVLVEPRRLAFTFVRAVDPALSRAHRLLLLSDTHLRPSSGERYRKIARAAKWARGDGAEAALLAGDLLEQDMHARVVTGRLREALGPLRAIVVFGNHEHYGAHTLGSRRRNDLGLLRDGFLAAGFELLDDAETTVGELRLVGTSWRDWRVGPSPRARELLARETGRALLLAHSPDQVVDAPAERVLLALCGHTHGGQIRFPILGAPVTETRVRLPHASGLMCLDGVRTYVTRGLGQTLHVRFGSVPEAVLLEVAPDRQAAPPADADVVEVPVEPCPEREALVALTR